MAPRKRKAEEEKPETVTKRVTRSSTRLAVATTAESNNLKNEKLKPKSETSKKGKAEQAQEAANKKLPKSRAREAKGKGKGKGKEVAEDDDTTADGDGSQNKTIVIEHCTQCHQFKKRALLVKDALEKGVSGITVLLNPDKPRRGCFEIREQGKTFISLLDMKRPFKPMKDLNMEEVIADVIDKIKK